MPRVGRFACPTSDEAGEERDGSSQLALVDEAGIEFEPSKRYKAQQWPCVDPEGLLTLSECDGLDDIQNLWNHFARNSPWHTVGSAANDGVVPR